MKKIFAVLAFALVGMTTASAQSYEYPRFHMGIRVGMSSTSNSFDDNDRLKSQDLSTPYGGLAMDFRIAPIPLYLETGLYYMDKGMNVRDKRYDYRSSYKSRSAFINMPLLISYHHYFSDKVAIQPFVGAVAGYLDDEEEIETAIRLGCGFNYGRLYANVGCDIGLIDHELHDYYYGYYDDRKMNTLFVTIGFNFIGAGR